MFASTAFYLPASHTKNHHQRLKNHKDWVGFFLDEQVSNTIKTEKSEQFLIQYMNEIHTDQVNWLDQPHLVEAHLLEQHHKVCQSFQDYVARRKTDAPREYFPTVSHAFEFLYQVAPVKMVDGAWLYSTLQQPQNESLRNLIYIYLEELGMGHPRANHVTMYQDLLQRYELTDFSEQLDDAYYEQATVQLALAYAPSEWMPLVIGFNLGYEQLPLHLLITNYELAELGIDPHYFNVHITIDNAHNGHAQKSLKAYLENFAMAKDQARYLELVKIGYLMNDIGKSSTQIIQELNIEKLALKVFKNKALIGQYIHNQKCQFSGKSINEWLSDPNQIQDFLKVMMDKGWIIQGQPVEQSRFWNLIDQAEGKMFGVFNATEKQMIKDWIQGSQHTRRLSASSVANEASLKDRSPHTQQSIASIKHRLNLCETTQEKIELLGPYIAPHLHYKDVGLWATQQLSRLLFPFQTQAMRYH